MLHRLIRLTCLLAVFSTSCSDDATTPEDDGPVTFSRLMGGMASGVITTSDGLSVVGGTFWGTMLVAGAADSMVATGHDGFLAAFRPDGSLAWQRRVGGASDEFLFAMARDSADDIYIGGRYEGETVFGGTNLPAHGLIDIFVARLDTSGHPVWTIGGGAEDVDLLFDIATTASGDVFACGIAGSEMTLAGEQFGEIGSWSGFLLKIHSNGAGGWAATATGAGVAACTAVATTGDGHVLVAGDYRGSSVEIAGSVLPIESGYQDGFIARYSVGGTPLGAIRIGGSGRTRLNDVTHINGGPVVVGTLTGTEDFDVSADGGEETSAGNDDAVVARYDVDGTFRWVRRIGAQGYDAALDVCRMGASDLLVVGTFEGAMTLGGVHFISRGSMDYFLVRFDADGNVIFARQLGGPGYDGSVAVTAAGKTMTVVGHSAGGEFKFPNGTTRATSANDWFIYQQP